MNGGRESIIEMLQAMADGEFYEKYRVLRTGEIERKEKEVEGGGVTMK